MAIAHIQAIDLISQGNWDDAHELIQSYHDELACLIHAYLHREEGDVNNANYWYSQTNQIMPENSLKQEFDRLSQLAHSEEHAG